MAAAMDLTPKIPTELFRSDAGVLEAWSPDSCPMLRVAKVGAAKLTLFDRGLALPTYADSAQIFYVLEGVGLVGVVFPESEQECVRNVKVGDTVAVPMGSFYWWFNSGTGAGSQPLRILSLGDTSQARVVGEFTYCHLMGPKAETGSIMHGFTLDFLAQAWDIDEASVGKLLGSQKQAVFVKVKEGITMPEAKPEICSWFGEFVYNCEDAKKDVDVKNGGRVAVLTSDNLAILKHIKLGADLVKLDKGALCSPGFSADAAFQITYVVKGSGRVQVVNNNGERIIDSKIAGGQFFIVPRFCVVSKRAGDEGLEWFSIITTEKPIFSHLAGRNSVWKALSPQVARAAFDVDDELEKKFRGKRTQEAIFFPPRTN